MSERRWVVVLGASSGFGEAAARAYAAASWDVFGSISTAVRGWRTSRRS